MLRCMWTRRLAVLGLAWLLVSFVEPAPAAEDAGRLTILSENGAHRFTVELALTHEEQARGLMHRRNLAPDAGMLFVYHVPQRAAFWMKNTLISLDMLFIDSGGRIVFIHEMAVPGSLRSIGPEVPIKAVLEIRGGRSRELGIRVGDHVRHPAFDSR